MRWLAVILLVGALAGAAWAQLPMYAPPLGTKGAGGGSYVGPLDAVSVSAKNSAVACYAFRACSAAIATALTKAFNIGHTAGTAIDVTVLANGNFDSASANSNCGGTGCTLIKAYEQIGNGYTLTNSGASTITFNCLNGFVCVTQNGDAGFGRNTSFAAQADPVSFSSVLDRNSANNGVSANIIGLANGATYGCTMGSRPAASTAYLWDGTTFFTPTMSDDHWHAMQGTITAGTNTSTVNVDGTETVGTISHCAVTANSIGIGFPAVGSGNDWGGKMVEAIVFNSSLSGADRTALCRNQQAYWGTGNFPANC